MKGVGDWGRDGVSPSIAGRRGVDIKVLSCDLGIISIRFNYLLALMPTYLLAGRILRSAL